MVTVQTFSSSPEERQEHVNHTSEIIDHSVSAINVYMTVAFDSHWWVACVKECTPEKHEVEVTFLHLHGLSPSNTYPDLPDPLTVDCQDVLSWRWEGHVPLPREKPVLLLFH